LGFNLITLFKVEFVIIVKILKESNIVDSIISIESDAFGGCGGRDGDDHGG